MTPILHNRVSYVNAGRNANNCRPKCSAYTGGIDCPIPAKLIHGVPAKRRRAATDGVYPPRPGRFVRSSDPPPYNPATRTDSSCAHGPGALIATFD